MLRISHLNFSQVAVFVFSLRISHLNFSQVTVFVFSLSCVVTSKKIFLFAHLEYLQNLLLREAALIKAFFQFLSCVVENFVYIIAIAPECFGNHVQWHPLKSTGDEDKTLS